MRDETLKSLTELIYGEGNQPPAGGNPFFDMLVELIEDEIDFAVGEALEESREDINLDDHFKILPKKRKP